MENVEWLSGQPMLDDGKLSGPVVNSRRQLWSVGGYLGMVVGSVFGVQTTNDGITVKPFITAKLRRETFAGSDAITLNNLSVRGKRMTVRVQLPPAAGQRLLRGGWHHAQRQAGQQRAGMGCAGR
jgi:hypothetical protein